MLDASIREALTAELEFYRARAAKDQEKIRALTAVLDPDDRLELFQLPLPMTTSTAQAPSSNGGRLAGLGLRQAILKVLAWHPSGLRPAELVARLEEGGYRPGGHLKTSQLVYGELYRLSEKKKVHKRRKRYLLVPEPAEMEVQP